MHPSIQSNFYLNLPAPSSSDDAKLRMTCHHQAVADFDIQLEMVDLEIKLCSDDQGVLPYQEAKLEELEERKVKLLAGKRFHANAGNAYWYYIEKQKVD